MIVYVDIDDTICRLRIAGNYYSAVPIQKAIEKVNQMFDDGHTIVMWTARGTVSGIDFKEMTSAQLEFWGLKYHELRMGKPAYDLFIDDKNIKSEDWLNEEKRY
jgi:hypothetical protein